MSQSTWEATKRFESLADCNHRAVLDDLSIDWTKLDTYGGAIVCLFSLFERMSGPVAVEAWLQSEGFETEGTSRRRGGTTRMKAFGYDPTEEIEVLSASWSLESQPKKFAKVGETDSLANSQSVWVAWFPDGKLAFVHALGNVK